MIPIYIIALDNDAFWGASFMGTLMCFKLVKEDENYYITYSKGQDKNIRINKNKYFTVKVKEAEKDAKLKEMNEWIGQYKQTASALYDTKQEILKHFDK